MSDMTAAFSPDVQLFGEASGPASRGAKVAALHLHESLLMEFDELIRDISARRRAGLKPQR